MERPYISSVFLSNPIETDSYLNNIPAVEFLIRGNRLDFCRNVTFLVGENGTGKSTLIEAIAVAYAARAGVQDEIEIIKSGKEPGWNKGKDGLFTTPDKVHYGPWGKDQPRHAPKRVTAVTPAASKDNLLCAHTIYIRSIPI